MRLIEAVMTPMHWAFLLQALTLLSIASIMLHIKTAEALDTRRRNPTNAPAFSVRSLSMWVQMGVLCWTVSYGHANGWDPWPPFVVFLAAYDAHVISQIVIMRADLARLPPQVDHAPQPSRGFGGGGGTRAG